MRPTSAQADRSLLIVVMLVACLSTLPRWAPAAQGIARRPLGGSRSMDAYPAPTLAPSATPSPDVDGFLPPPAALPHEVAPLDQAPAADLLLDLWRRLGERDLSGLVAGAGGERRPLLFMPWGPWDSEGVEALDPATAEALLADLLDGSGDQPRLQGLFHLPSPSGDGACAEVLLHRFAGGARWPTAPASLTGPTRTATTEAGPSGGPSPADLGPESAAWRFCRGSSEVDWTWETWRSGPYHGLLDRIAARHPGTLYWVLRP